MRWRSIGLLFAASVAAVAFGPRVHLAQAPSQAPAPTADLRVATTLVVIPVTVTDPKNRFVLDLTRSDFTLLEDGVEQKIAQFAGEEAPISTGLLVDTSGSMGTKMELTREAVADLMKTMNEQDEAALVEFSDHAQLTAPFPASPATLEDKLSHVEAGGLTALLDAISLGLDEMKHARNARKALLIISDGGDNNSRYTADQIKELVRQADVQVYAMGVFERFPAWALSAAELSGPKLLAQLADQTGGRSFSATSLNELPSIATRIGIELRNQYVLAYTPTNHKRDGTWRHVEVRLKPPAGMPPLKARWRVGYYAARGASE